VIARQHLENALENAVLRPPAETLMDNLPIPEALGKITPGNPGSISVQNGFDEQSIVPFHMAFATRKKTLDPIPLIVA
jgi:hypothetical protein